MATGTVLPPERAAPSVAPGLAVLPPRLSAVPAAGARRAPGELLWRDHRGRPGLLGQLLVVGVFLGGYDLIRDVVQQKAAVALTHASSVFSFERHLGVGVEHALNARLGTGILGGLAGAYYDSAHWFVTMGVLAWLWVRRPTAYRVWRDLLLWLNVVGLVVYWVYPLAPPRLTPGHGFTDTVARTHALGGWSTTITHAADQYAAMPSLHIAWALWSSAAVLAAARHRLRSRRGEPRTAVRRLALGGVLVAAAAYPLLTTVVILATANHWVVDALAGAALLGATAAVLVPARAALDRGAGAGGGAVGPGAVVRVMSRRR